MPDDLWGEGIDGPHSLASTAVELAAATAHLLEDVLPFTPQRWPLLRLVGLLCRGELRSADMFHFQWRGRHFYMERHLDSTVVRNLCNDPQLRQQLTKHLDESLILWRSEIWVSRLPDPGVAPRCVSAPASRRRTERQCVHRTERRR